MRQISSLGLSVLTLFVLSSRVNAAEGDPIPQAPLTEFSQTNAASMDDFAGQAVLLEFFAFWCGPCGQQVPHLNEISEKYSSKGLVVLGITKEGKGETEKWIKEKNAQFPYAYDRKGEWGRILNIESLPTAVLVNPRGQILWQGHPANLQSDVIESAIKGAIAHPITKWPSSAKAVKASFIKRQFAKAKQSADTVAKSSPQGAEVAKALNQYVQDWTSMFREQLSSANYLPALELGSELKKDLAGLAEGAELEKALKELEMNKSAMNVIKGQKEVRAIKKEKLTKPSDGEAILGKLDKIVDDFPETAAARDARSYKMKVEAWMKRAAQKEAKG